MASKQQGFSLIELMVVVAIIAILAAIAIPLYMNYSTEAEGSEGYMLADGVKEAVVSHFVQLGSWPTTNQAADLSPAASISGKYVESVKVSSTSVGSVIAVHFRTNGVAKALQDKYLYLSSMGESGSVHWVCQVEYTNMYQYVPTTCRNKH